MFPSDTAFAIDGRPRTHQATDCTRGAEAPPMKTVGILGGMGPAATADFFDRMVKATAARRDQDHLHIIVDNQPAVGSAIESVGQRPRPEVRIECDQRCARGLEERESGRPRGDLLEREPQRQMGEAGVSVPAAGARLAALTSSAIFRPDRREPASQMSG